MLDINLLKENFEDLTFVLQGLYDNDEWSWLNSLNISLLIDFSKSINVDINEIMESRQKSIKFLSLYRIDCTTQRFEKCLD